MSEVRFEFDLNGHGWIDGVFEIDGQRAEVTASYLSDGPEELLAAVSSLTRIAESARASWEDEPGEYRWVFDRAGENVRVRVLWFDEILEGDDDDGQLLVNAECSRRELVAAVVSAAEGLLDRYGEVGYAKSWEHPFPVTQLTLLQGWLDSH